ncbi:metal-dependent hydrolase [Halorarius halobius]|uniref:metal-dependent hydrolase n=1 Tax=Halorarius halobius TaxID=2962671 RepID=UPI0020CDBF21|nr:metal-dependent hydrolase [Halorarius halobius]
MWPWGHAAFGYLLYSLSHRLATRKPPSDRPTVVLLAASLFPDLVDKPLSWGWGLFPSGYAVGHSALVAVPLGLLVVGIALLRGWPAEGLAFTVGYWSHLVGDVLYASAREGELAVSLVLWPLVSLPPYATDRGLFGRTVLYLHEFLAGFASGSFEPLTVALYVGPLSAAALLWLLDGRPGVPMLGRS